MQACTYFARVTFVFFNGGVRDEPHIVVHVEVEERTRLASGLGDDQIVERVVLEKEKETERKSETTTMKIAGNKIKRKIQSNNSTTKKNKEIVSEITRVMIVSDEHDMESASTERLS